MGRASTAVDLARALAVAAPPAIVAVWIATLGDGAPRTAFAAHTYNEAFRLLGV